MGEIIKKICAWAMASALLPALVGCAGLPQFDAGRIIRYLLLLTAKTVAEVGRKLRAGIRVSLRPLAEIKMNDFPKNHHRCLGRFAFTLGVCLANSLLLFAVKTDAQAGAGEKKLTSEDYATYILENKEGRVHKWNKKIYVVLLRADNKDKNEYIKYVSERLLFDIRNKVKNIDITAGDGNKNNLLILPTSDAYKDILGRYKKIILQNVKDEEQLQAIAVGVSTKRYACASHVTALKGQIFKGFIIIDTRLDNASIARCVSAKLLRVLGLLGMSENDEAMVSDKEIIFPTDYDYRALEILYDDKIKPGDGYSALRAKIFLIMKR